MASKTAKKKPVSEFSKKMFFVKPMLLDNEGYENWEIASHKREELTRFMNNVETFVDEFELLSGIVAFILFFNCGQNISYCPFDNTLQIKPRYF